MIVCCKRPILDLFIVTKKGVIVVHVTTFYYVSPDDCRVQDCVTFYQEYFLKLHYAPYDSSFTASVSVSFRLVINVGMFQSRYLILLV